MKIDALAVSIAALLLTALVQIVLVVRGFARVEAKVEFQGETQKRHEDALEKLDERVRKVEMTSPATARR